MRAAVIGLGYAALDLHVPALRHDGQVELVGGADTVAAHRDRWTAQTSTPAYTDVDELLERTRPDVVAVCTPPGSHADLAVQALAAGAHVICEKPFTETLDQAHEVLQAAGRAGRFVAVNQEFRYMPAFAALSEVAGRADVGRPVFLLCEQFMDLAPWDEKVAWRAGMSHRSLFEGGVHIVDLMVTVLGRAPRTVMAMTSSGLDPARDADAIHLVMLDFGDGLLGQITIDRLCRSATRYLDVRLDCEHASVRASIGGRAFVRLGLKRAERPGLHAEFGLGGLAWLERGTRREVVARNPREPGRAATTALYADTMAALRAGREPRASARSVLDTMRVIAAAYESATTGRAVELGPAEPTDAPAALGEQPG